MSEAEREHSRRSWFEESVLVRECPEPSAFIEVCASQEVVRANSNVQHETLSYL